MSPPSFSQPNRHSTSKRRELGMYMKSREGIVEEEWDSLHIKIGGEIIPGLLDSIRKATSERREYDKGKPQKSRG